MWRGNQQVVGALKTLVVLAALAVPARSAWRLLRAPMASGAAYPFPYRHMALKERAASEPCRVMFVGDSITDCLADTVEWDRELVPQGAVDFGVSWDDTADVYYRLSDGELPATAPAAVVLMIGTNDFGGSPKPGRVTGPVPPAAEVARRVQRIVDLIRQREPSAKIVLMGILPRGDRPELAGPIRECNAILATTPGVTFLDVGEKFLRADGSVDPALMPDLLHPSPAGYRLWVEALLPLLPHQ
jgi:lysophospholipase L1-like esterase